MKYLSILIIFLLTILSNGCNNNDDSNGNSGDGDGIDGIIGTDGGGDTGGDDDGETTGGDIDQIDYFICNDDCIWIQEDCNGNWFIAYNIDSDISGIQFNIDGASIISASGGDAASFGFSITASATTIIGFSIGGNYIPSGYGKLVDIELSGDPTGISGIVFAGTTANNLIVSYYGLIDCNSVLEDNIENYYVVDLENTGESQLTIFEGTITSLYPGDQVGIFDLTAIINYNDCSNQIGELLVGAGTWNGSQLNIVSTGSVDLCAFGGSQLAGFVEGNDVVVKIWKAAEQVEYATDLTWSVGTGVFGDIIQVVSEISLVD